MISDFLEIYCLVNSKKKFLIRNPPLADMFGWQDTEVALVAEVIRKYSDSNTQIMLTREVDSFLARDSEAAPFDFGCWRFPNILGYLPVPIPFFPWIWPF